MAEKTRVTINGWTQDRRSTRRSNIVVLRNTERRTSREIVMLPKTVKINKGTISDGYFPLPRLVTLPKYEIATEPVKNDEFRVFLCIMGNEKRLESLLRNADTKKNANEFWALPARMSWYEAAGYCNFFNKITITDTDPAWNYTVPSRAQWMHAFRNSEELVTFKNESGDLLYEWTSDLSGSIEWPPAFEGRLKPLPMTTMRYNRESDKSIEYASWRPDWDFSIVFRPVRELIPSASHL